MSRKKIPARHNNRQRIQFAYNADRDSPIGQVLQYLLKSELILRREGKHKGLNAISAFWKPFAYKDNDQLSEAEKRAIARESIEILTRQIELIRSTLRIESASCLGDTTKGAETFSQEVRSVITEVIQEFFENGGIPATALSATSLETNAVSKAVRKVLPNNNGEGVDFDEEALLGSLFGSAE